MVLTPAIGTPPPDGGASDNPATQSEKKKDFVVILQKYQQGTSPVRQVTDSHWIKDAALFAEWKKKASALANKRIGEGIVREILSEILLKVPAKVEGIDEVAVTAPTLAANTGRPDSQAHECVGPTCEERDPYATEESDEDEEGLGAAEVEENARGGASEVSMFMQSVDAEMEGPLKRKRTSPSVWRRSAKKKMHNLRMRTAWRWDWLQLRLYEMLGELHKCAKEYVHHRSSKSGPDVHGRRCQVGVKEDCSYATEAVSTTVQGKAPVASACTASLAGIPDLGLGGVTRVDEETEEADMGSCCRVNQVKYSRKRSLVRVIPPSAKGKKAKKGRNGVDQRTAHPLVTLTGRRKPRAANNKSRKSAVSTPTRAHATDGSRPSSGSASLAIPATPRTPIQSPRHPMSPRSTPHTPKGRGRGGFDINDVVLPGSMLSHRPISVVKSKEILTPTWRLLPTSAPTAASAASTSPGEGGPPLPTTTTRAGRVTVQKFKANLVSPPRGGGGGGAGVGSPTVSTPPVTVHEDVSDEAYLARHLTLEVEERKRILPALQQKKSSAGTVEANGKSKPASGGQVNGSKGGASAKDDQLDINLKTDFPIMSVSDVVNGNWPHGEPPLYGVAARLKAEEEHQNQQLNAADAQMLFMRSTGGAKHGRTGAGAGAGAATPRTPKGGMRGGKKGVGGVAKDKKRSGASPLNAKRRSAPTTTPHIKKIIIKFSKPPSMSMVDTSAASSDTPAGPTEHNTSTSSSHNDTITEKSAPLAAKSVPPPATAVSSATPSGTTA